MSQFVLVTAYDGLYILGNFTAPRSKANKGIVEIERLRKDFQLKLSYYNMTDALGKKVILHNVRSFAKHQADIFNDFWYWKADVIIFAESNIDYINASDIKPNFDILYPLLCTDGSQKRKARGLLIVAKKHSGLTNLSKNKFVEGISENLKPWHIDLRTFILDGQYFIVEYKSPLTPSKKFEEEFGKLFDAAPKDVIISIMGDFNIDMKAKNWPFLQDFYNQIGDLITTDANTQIDNFFSSSHKGFGGTYSSYFSDHFAIFYQTNKSPETVRPETINSQVFLKPAIVPKAKVRKLTKDVLKPSSNTTAPVHVNQDLIKYVLFPNSKTVTIDHQTLHHQTLRVYYLRTYNAFIQGMICLYHTDPEVRTSISGSTHSYFINLEK